MMNDEGTKHIPKLQGGTNSIQEILVVLEAVSYLADRPPAGALLLKAVTTAGDWEGPTLSYMATPSTSGCFIGYISESGKG